MKVTAQRSTATLTFKPAPLRVSTAFFAVSSLLFFTTLYVVLPALLRAETSWFAAFNITLVLPMALLGAAAIGACQLEGFGFSWPSLRDRLRLGWPNLCTWLWAAALSAFMYGGRWAIHTAFAVALVALSREESGNLRRMWLRLAGVATFLGISWVLWQTEPWLKFVRIYEQPVYVREFLSRFGPNDFMGLPLAGRWWIAVYYFAILLFCNVLGEELWWRGYLLPRQELAHGSIAWIYHGVLWSAFHLFFQWTLWDVVRMMPTCCALSFVAQHRRNTWPGIIAHFFANHTVLFQVVQGVAS